MVPGGSVAIMRYQSLPLPPRESPPRMCHTVVLASGTPWGAFRRGFRQVPRSLDSETRSDVTTWALSHQVFITGATCISSKGPCIPSPLPHAGQLGLLGRSFLAWRLGDYLHITLC